ncbi:MAG: HDOD domain-containing protein [Planctomycetaceae bacterium]|nr:HDOD domain-containing protein [Planctomycetaceae bacterium]
MSINWTNLRKELIGDRTKSVLPPSIKLPMLPQALTEFLHRAEDPNSGVNELGQIIQSDSGLTCELLRYVNSSSIGLRQKVSTAPQAVSLLGIRPTKLFLMSAGVQNAMKACKSRLMNIQSFWTTNLERALFSREIAVLLRVSPELAYAGSMLHDFLLPMLCNELFDQYYQFVQTPENIRRPLVAYEKEVLGWDHALATAQVMSGWEFPDDLTCCVLLHHGGLATLCDPEIGRSAAAAVAVAALMPDTLRQPGDGLAELIKLEQIWPQFNLNELAGKVQSQLEAASAQAGQHFSLARRLEKARAALPETVVR